MRRTYHTLNDCELQHNAEVGLFTKPSTFITGYLLPMPAIGLARVLHQHHVLEKNKLFSSNLKPLKAFRIKADALQRLALNPIVGIFEPHFIPLKFILYSLRFSSYCTIRF